MLTLWIFTMLYVLFIDKIHAHNHTDHCSQKIGESKETKTEANICYVITQCSWLNRRLHEPEIWPSCSQLKGSEIFSLAESSCVREYRHPSRWKQLGHTKGTALVRQMRDDLEVVLMSPGTMVRYSDIKQWKICMFLRGRRMPTIHHFALNHCVPGQYHRAGFPKLGPGAPPGFTFWFLL